MKYDNKLLLQRGKSGIIYKEVLILPILKMVRLPIILKDACTNGTLTSADIMVQSYHVHYEKKVRD